MIAEPLLHGETKEDIADVLGSAYIDSRVYSKMFYPDRFTLPFSGLHDEMFKLIDAKDDKGEPLYRQIVIKAPRGIGKTSLAKTIAAKRVRFDDVHFLVYIGKSHDFACLQTESIKTSMLQNRLEDQYFKPIRAKTNKDSSDTFSKKAWLTSTGVMVWPRGRGQPVRGLLHDWKGKSYRPDLFIIDDLEDPDLIENEEYRKETKFWLLADVVEAVPLPGVSTNWQIIYIDTLKHEDSCLQMLLDSGDWKSLELSICDESYKSLAPNFISDEALMKKVKHHRERFTMDVFYREQMGIAISTEDAAFQASYFKYYDEADEEFRERLKGGYIENVVIIDPAKTAKMHNAQSGLVVWGIDVNNGRMYLRAAIGAHFYPDQLYEEAFRLCQTYKVRALGIETTGLNEFVLHPLRNEMMRRGLNYEIVELKARSGQGTEFSGRGGGKKARIAALIPYYRQGLIYHNQGVSADYEAQLLSFPRSKRWDLMDAAAYIVEMLEMGLRYFEPSDYAGDDYSDPKVLEAIEGEYEGLMDSDYERSSRRTEWRPL